MQAPVPLPGRETAMAIVNLTPHPINLFDSDGNQVVIQSSGCARCAVTTETVGSVDGVKVNVSHFGAVTGLPEPQAGTVYVVSAMVLSALHGTREDVLGLSEYVRDEQGRTVGARALTH